MTRKIDIARNLPFRIALDEREAAVSMSFSPSHFRKLVDDGRMPQPREADGRVTWDVEELIIAYRALPRRGANGQEVDISGAVDNPWARMKT